MTTGGRSFPRLRTLLGVVFLATVCGHARAAVWVGGSPQGRLGVILHYQGSAEQGRFTRFRVRLVTRHGIPETLRVVVKTASFTLASALLDSASRGRAWFDARRDPKAVYTAEHLRAVPGGVRADGVLTLKGIARPLDFVMNVAQAGPRALVLRGRTVVLRLRYRIGTGAWSKTDLIGNRVDLVFRVPLVRAGR